MLLGKCGPARPPEPGPPGLSQSPGGASQGAEAEGAVVSSKLLQLGQASAEQPREPCGQAGTQHLQEGAMLPSLGTLLYSQAFPTQGQHLCRSPGGQGPCGGGEGGSQTQASCLFLPVRQGCSAAPGALGRGQCSLWPPSGEREAAAHRQMGGFSHHQQLISPSPGTASPGTLAWGRAVPPGPAVPITDARAA